MRPLPKPKLPTNENLVKKEVAVKLTLGVECPGSRKPFIAGHSEAARLCYPHRGEGMPVPKDGEWLRVD